MLNSRIFYKIINGIISVNNVRNCDDILLKATFSSTSTSLSNNIQPISMAYDTFSNSENVTGIPLLIMHGLFGSKKNWRTVGKVLQKKLSPNRTIFTVDARNHGDSPHSSEHTYDHLTVDILEFLKEHNIDKVALMGHSMGGRAMMNFALKYPDRVEKLIVIDISPVNRAKSLEGMNLLIQTMKQIELPKELQMQDARKIAVDKLSKLIDKGTSDFILLNLKKLPNGPFYWSVNLDALGENITYIRSFPEINEKYSGPTLFIGGRKSDFIEQGDLNKIKNWFPNAILEWIDAGHVIHFEKPAEFLELVTKFINLNNT